MNLYVDDNFSNPALVGLLRKANHQVVRPADASMRGASDAKHLEFAIRSGFAILTADRVDFRDLHDLIQASGGTHPGILLVRFENDPKRDMKPKHIVAAINNLERSGHSVVGQIAILNQWR
jgi:predicted nuclease of predicted toxin-antitoxin system